MSADEVDTREREKFDRMAAEWWDPDGPAAPLHRLNPLRLDYVADMIAAQFDRDRRAARPFEGLEVVDVGCGGGLLTEPMARLGARTTGVDASAPSVDAARAHAGLMGLDVDYAQTTAEALGAEGRRFDVVLAMEIVEHTPDPRAFVQALATLAKPGGLVLMSTLNRTTRSFLTAIVGAEYVLRWLPRGTHDWRRFLTPAELSRFAERAGLKVVDRTGMVYSPLADRWRLDGRDLSVNYLLTAEKEAASSGA